MYREIIINSRPDLVKVAVLEDGQLSELFIEKVEETRLTGNIYKGKVAIVLPGMQAAFVNTGIGRNTFLYVDDVLPRMDGIETDEEQKRTTVSIKNVLKTGQEILVQISKEPSGSKGARVTRAISLPGRFVVLMPSVDFVGVSRRVGDADERERLKKIAKKFKPESMGLIVRTVAEGRTEDDINADIQELALLWKKIEQKASQVSSPALLHRDLELVPRTIRDLVNDETAAIVADTKEAHEEIMAYLGDVAPHLMGKVSLFQPSNPIFEHYNVEKQIDKALRRKVWLKCGGYIVIDKTEALTSIDVNTGKFVGSSTLEDTVLKTNLEATREIAKQLRLRSIGGIIIIDFID
ncbi:MAG: Rne/Rng family ribonuclease, partial [bacterium]|nr:Rne/Rng family ribonuclease [bacterium]